MPAFRQLMALSLLSLLACHLVQAQKKDQGEAKSVSAPTITMSAAAGRVRFTAPGAVVRVRLEIYAAEGLSLFDVSGKGSVLDWALADGAGQRVADGSYLCVVTVKGLDGKLTQRIGTVSVEGERVSVRAAKVAELSAAQQQAVGPVEEDAALTVLEEGDVPALTVLEEGDVPALTLAAHDGQDGQVTSTAGALTFRTGNVFAGRDKEQMRITPDGRIGIGTDKPQATLDVAGTIRAERVMIARPATQGDNQTSTEDSAGVEEPLATGSGTQNFIAKWTDNAGTLGNAAITETNGNVVVGESGQTGNVQIFGTADQDIFAGMGQNVNVGPAFNFGYGGFSFGRGAGFFNVRPDALAAAPNPSLRFMTANVERMIVTNLGDVGIGTTAPGAKLDVTGNINTSTQFNIGGNRVLSLGGAFSTFLGVGTGTTGTNNSFFGRNAGSLNASGGDNSFFGRDAGNSNTSGGRNTIIGAFADLGANNLTNATAIGYRATVTQSNSLVLGSVNFENGATSDTKVGIGTTAPVAALHVRGISNNPDIPIAVIHSGGNSSTLSFRTVSTGLERARLTSNVVFTSLSTTGPTSSIRFDAGNNAGGGADMAILAESGNVGIGTTTPVDKLEVSGAIRSSGSDGGTFIAFNPTNQAASASFGWFDNTARIRYGGNGEGATNGFVIQGPGDVTKLAISNDGTVRVGLVGEDDALLSVFGRIALAELGTGGETPLCHNINSGQTSFHTIATCSSSLRYKTDVQNFTPGLDLLSRLRPVSFRWKGSGRADVGFVAEEVAEAEPLLATRNESGEVEGVKYDRIAVVLLNAVREQQAQISEQRRQIELLQRQNSALGSRLSEQAARLGVLERGVSKNASPRRRP